MSRLNAASPALERLPVLLILALISAGPWLGPSALAAPEPVGDGFSEPGLGSVELVPYGIDALPPIPDLDTFPVQLVLDDDSAEGAFGIVGANARQFLWFNRFDDPGPIALDEIWVLFPAGTDVVVGDSVQLVVFADADGDPTNGAQVLATFDEVVQVADGVTFSVYQLPTPVQKSTPGDVLIGVVNRYFMTGIDPPPTLPAAFDSTTPQTQSYFALWAGDPPNPPDLGSATAIDLFTGAAEGNFMIRGFGRPQPFTIPALGSVGLALLTALLALTGAFLVARR